MTKQQESSTRKRKRISTAPSDEAPAADAAAVKTDGVATAKPQRQPLQLRRNRKTLTADDKKALEDEFAASHAQDASTAERPAKRRKTGASFELVEHGLWRGWQEVFFVGTEWTNYDLITSQARWDFDHLEEALFEGELKDKKVFLFGSTEPQTIGSDHTVYLIPTITAVVGDIAPPTKLGIKSVQMEKEEFVTLDDMKMTWTPLMPKVSERESSDYTLEVPAAAAAGAGTAASAAAAAASGKKVRIPRIQMLHCNLRMQQLKTMKEEDKRRYEYCLPYFVRPRDMLDKDQYPQEVIGSTTIEGRGISYEFNWDMDDLEDYVEDLCKDHEITDKAQQAAVKQAIADDVKRSKQAIKDSLAKKRAELEHIPPHVQDAMNNVQLYKFYPKNKDIDLEAHNLKSNYVNRYYGRATKVL